MMSIMMVMMMMMSILVVVMMKTYQRFWSSGVRKGPMEAPETDKGLKVQQRSRKQNNSVKTLSLLHQ